MANFASQSYNMSFCLVKRYYGKFFAANILILNVK